ncbi:MAG: molybdopterin-dependent oxidoreductase [Chloroflexi bacterium]|nr:molybdopterin-dependent oxidoreductase [Chloroflexota bacterium]
MLDTLNARLSRRRFLALSAATLGAAAGANRLVSATTAAGGAEAQAAVQDEWIASCCNMCGGTTGILCHVVDGKLVKIEPNPMNPVGVTNVSADFWRKRSPGAAMCPKGNAGPMALYDPDRVKRPLRRTNPVKGKGIDPRWREISWDEALDEIAGRLRALRDAGTPEALLWFTEDNSFVDIQQDFCGLYGTPNLNMHSNLCDVSRKASFKSVIGHDRPLGDFANTRYMLLFGWNPLSATKWSHLPRIFANGFENGAKLVVVDPYLSFTAARAHEWIPLRPSTDGALALAMGHYIVKEKLQDEAFIRDWAVGFDRYAQYVADKTPEWAEKITSVPANTIRRVAYELATTKPAVVDVWSGPGQHSNAVQGGRAITMLVALTGNVDKPGTLIIPQKGGGAHPPIKFKKTDKPRFDGLERYPMGHGSGVYPDAINRILDGAGPYPVRVGMVFFQNLVLSIPGTQKVIDALSKLEFLAVVDNYLSETAELADIVLPGTTYLERYELLGQWVTWPVITLRQPVVKPIFGQPPEYDIVIELGRRLDLRDSDGNPFFKDLRYDDYVSKMIEGSAAKMTLAELRQRPGAVWMDLKGTQYEKHKAEVASPEGATVDSQTGSVRDKDGKLVGVRVAGKTHKGFATASGKLELYSDTLAKKRDANGSAIDGLPAYSPRDWWPDERYPLFLVNWKEASHTHSRTMNNPYLLGIEPENRLRMNKRTAERLGIRDGDEVWVESPYGKDRARVHVTEGIHPEVVGWQHGFGHWGFGRYASKRGTADGQFRLPGADPISGQAMHKEVCVRVYRV